MDKKIQKKKKFIQNKILLFFISFATIFMSIGYASINSISFNINGAVNAHNQDGIFITDVYYKNSNNIDISSYNTFNFYQNIMNSNIFLDSNDLLSFVTYSVVIYNNTNYDHSFVGVVYDDQFYSNDDIIVEVNNDFIGDKIVSKGYITVDITFRFKDGVTGINNNLNSYLNFKFIKYVRYIEGTGTQYIDTLIMPNNKTTFEMNFALMNVNSIQAICGTRTSMDGIIYNMFLYKLKNDDRYKLRWDENGMYTNYSQLYLNVGELINFKKNIDNYVISIGSNTETLPFEQGEWSLDSSFYIFNQNQQSSAETRLGLIKLYDFKMYQDGVLVRNYFPTIDDNNTPCLYDAVSHNYFYNCGSGVFLYSLY